jgi:hypothetical protein
MSQPSYLQPGTRFRYTRWTGYREDSPIAEQWDGEILDAYEDIVRARTESGEEVTFFNDSFLGGNMLEEVFILDDDLLALGKSLSGRSGD